MGKKLVHAELAEAYERRIFPFVLSLSKQERTLKAVNGLFNPHSFFESFFNPYPSTRFLRQAQDRQGERTGKALFDVLPSIHSGRGRTNGASGLKTRLWQTFIIHRLKRPISRFVHGTLQRRPARCTRAHGGKPAVERI
ncbi:MAG: hypothetical protein LBD67_04920 [Candidatus Accumulibacter sp.]|nr:hypothetical protein [Accumulibacter sp.]